MTKRPLARFLSRLLILSLVLLGGIQMLAWAAEAPTLSIQGHKPAKASANSIYTFEGVYTQKDNVMPEALYTFKGGVTFGAAGEEFLQGSVDVFFDKKQCTVEADKRTILLNDVDRVIELLHVYTDAGGTTDIMTTGTVVDNTQNPPRIVLDADTDATTVYVSFYGTGSATLGPEKFAVNKVSIASCNTQGRSVANAPSPAVFMLPEQDPLVPPGVMDYGAITLDSTGIFQVGTKMPIPATGKDGLPVTLLKIDYSYAAMGQTATLDSNDSTRKTILLQDNISFGPSGAPLVFRIVVVNDPLGTDYVQFMDTTRTIDNKVVLTSPLPTDAGTPGHEIKVDYMGRVIHADLTLSSYYEVDLRKPFNTIIGVWANQAMSGDNLFTTPAGNGSIVPGTNKIRLNTLPGDLAEVWVQYTGSIGGNHVRVSQELDPADIIGVFLDQDTTGTNYLGPNDRITVTPADPNATPPFPGRTDIQFASPLPDGVVNVFVAVVGGAGGMDTIVLPDNPDLPWIRVIGVYEGSDGTNDFFKGGSFDPATRTITLGEPYVDNDGEPLTKPPYVYMAYASTVYVEGSFGTFPMVHRRWAPIDGAEFAIQLSAGLNSQNAPILSINGQSQSWEPLGLPAFLSAPGLNSQGAPAYEHRFRLIVPYIIETGSKPAAGMVRSAYVSGPTVVDSSPGTGGALAPRFGGTSMNRDWNFDSWTAVDPLEPLPLDISNPDNGSGSSVYTFRVVYRNSEGLEPQPWLPPSRDSWLNTNYNSGVVLYLDGDGTGNFVPHFMVKEDPNDNDPTDGIVYIYKVLPQAWSNAIGMPNYNFQDQNMYRALTAGVHRYFFGCSDDYIRDWNDNLVTTPDLEPVGPNNTYRTYHDFQQNLVDREVNVPGPRTENYDFDCLEYPKVAPVLSKVDESDRQPLGGPRFLGTLVPYQKAYEPANLASGQFETAALFSGQIATFRVTYTNAENDPPLWIKVYINNTADSSGPYTGYTMYPSDPTNTDYRAGVVYEYQTTMTPGPHTYYFMASDRNRQTKFPVRPDRMTLSGRTYDDPYVPSILTGNDYIPGPYVNNPPVLFNYSVTPSSGRRGQPTDFVYEVTYRDADGQRPNSAYVIIQLRDGGTLENGGAVRVAMTPVTQTKPTPDEYRAGVRYRFLLSSTQYGVLQPGERRYYFEFTDDWGMQSNDNILIQGERTRLPAGEGTWISGPIITDNQKPTLTGKVESTDKANNTASIFVYSAAYADADNDAPAYINVYISDDNGITWKSPKPMTKRDTSDNNYIDGCIYEYKTQLGLPNPKYLFRFAASDGLDAVTTEPQEGPNVAENTPPTLLDGLLSPGKGSPAGSANPTPFLYSVTYKDVDGQLGQPPAYVRVYIDGKPFDMAPVDPNDVSYNDGRTYTYTTELAPGNHRYHFETSDGKDKAVFAKVYDPRTNLITDFTGPAVVDLPVLENPGVNPETGGKSDYRFVVTYRDPNGLPPNDGYPLLFLDDPGGLDPDRNAYVMAKVNPGDTNYVTGVQYQKVLRGLRVGTHSFHCRSITTIQVGDVIDKTTIKTDEVNKPTVLNGLPILTSGELDRQVGTAQTSFKFNVTYRDPDGDSPLPNPNDPNAGYIYLEVDGTKKYPMTSQDGSTNYTAGVIFTVSVLGADLGNGQHTFRFVARDKDGIQDVILPPLGQAAFSGPMVNSAPSLNTGVVDPTTGSARTTFTYSVKYVDADGTAPEYVRVYVDGVPNTMALADTNPNYKTGARFIYATKVEAADSHNFWFEASDGVETTILPADGTKFSGPVIQPNTLPTLSEQSLTPLTGTTADTFTWRIKYTDAEGDVPDSTTGGFVRVVISDPSSGSVQEYDMTRIDTNPIADGTIYEYKSKLKSGRYFYYFRASDGSAEDVTDPATGLPDTAYQGPTVAIPPTWFGAGVTPEVGGTRTTFEFHVTYTTEIVNPTVNMTAVIDGNAFPMQKEVANDNDFTDGVTYIYRTRLAEGIHNFKFVLTGSENRQYPEDGSTISGPLVNSAPVLSNAQVTPLNTRVGGGFTMSVKYSDADAGRDGPAYVKAVINNQEFNMTPAAGTPDYKAGVVYTYETGAINESKNLAVTFKASDGVEEVTAPAAPINVSVNALPVLSNESVDPSSGSSNTQFTYKVTYADAEDTAPNYVKLFLSRDGGSTWDAGTAMTKVGTGSYVDGVEYRLTTTIKNPGRMAYQIKAWDGFYVNGVEDPVATDVHLGPSMSFAGITLVAPTTMMLTETSNVTGQLTTDIGTPLAGKTVLVTYFRPDGTGSDSQSVMTDANGNFARAFTPTMDNVQAGGGASIPWLVRALWDGDATYSAAKAEAQVNVTPAERDVPTSVAMISIPVMPRNGDPAMLFDPISNVKLARYMPDQLKYFIYGIDSNFPFYTLGSAYWVKGIGPARIRASGRLANPTDTFIIPMSAGWNQFSSVHVTPVNIGNVRVVRNGEEVSLATAAQRGWIRDYAWRWDAAARTYRMVSATQQNAERNLQPWEGYWIRALENCDLVIPAAVLQ